VVLFACGSGVGERPERRGAVKKDHQDVTHCRVQHDDIAAVGRASRQARTVFSSTGVGVVCDVM
jgi:hypothetical protein